MDYAAKMAKITSQTSCFTWKLSSETDHGVDV